MTASLVSPALVLVVFAELLVVLALCEAVFAEEAAALDFAVAPCTSPFEADFPAAVALPAESLAAALVSLPLAAVLLAAFFVSPAFCAAESIPDGA
ncbi:MAG: hypothetical protein ACLQDQ_07415 [Myxococcaceae bacterium]